jgi:hypothetical protein
MTEHRFALLLEGPDALLGIRIGKVVDHDRAARAVCRVQAQLQLPAVEPLSQRYDRTRFARYGGADSLQLCLQLTGLHQLQGGQRRSKYETLSKLPLCVLIINSVPEPYE